MGLEQIQNFITFPELPDIVSYIFIFAILIIEYFVKKFVQKDNLLTLSKVDDKTKILKKLETELKEAKKELEEERKNWKEEKDALVREISLIKKAVRISSGNTKELVSNGTANHIANMLPIDDSDNNIVEEEKDE